MTTWRLIFRMLEAQGMRHGLTALIVALGVALMATSAALSDAGREAVSAAATRFPLVVGARVGAVPLVLGSLTRLQDLGAGLDVEVYHRLGADPRVAQVVPVLAGHAVQGHALVGTSVGYLEPRERYPLAAGRLFDGGAMEVVLGSEAARGLSAEPGHLLSMEHQHADAPQDPGMLTVVGVLKATGTDLDDTMLCPVEAIHGSHRSQEEGEPHPEGHAHGERISSLLIRPTDAAALLSLQEELAPSYEVALTGQTFRRITDRLSVGNHIVGLLVGGIVLVTFLSLVLSTWSASLAQGREVAILRVMGASRGRVVAVILGVTSAVSLGGMVGGVGLGSLLSRWGQHLLTQDLGLDTRVTLLSPSTLAWLGGALAVLLLVGIQPALAAYHLQAAEALGDAGAGRSTRSWFRWSLRLVLPLLVFAWAQYSMGRHTGEVPSVPLPSSSREVFQALSSSQPGDPPPLLARMDGADVEIHGWIYALGDPYEVRDFFLVGMDPNLPRCPFCYRAPTRQERIQVRGGGRTFEAWPGQVKVRGRFHIQPEGDDPWGMDLEELEVVLQ